jgi:ELWxxDGT repeat protein
MPRRTHRKGREQCDINILVDFHRLETRAMLSMSMIKDINTDSDNSDANYLLNVGGTLFFQGTDGFTGKELLRSDGTPEGTYLVDDIMPGKQHSFPEPIADWTP